MHKTGRGPEGPPLVHVLVLQVQQPVCPRCFNFCMKRPTSLPRCTGLVTSVLSAGCRLMHETCMRQALLSSSFFCSGYKRG